MKKETFNTLINNINSLTERQEEELKSLVQQYDYFPLAHMLYAKNLHTDSNPDFENALAKAAIHAYDRERLFHLIERTPILHLDSVELNTNIETEKLNSVESIIDQKIDVEEKEQQLFESAPYEIEMLGELSKMDEVSIHLQPIGLEGDDTADAHTFTGWLTSITGIYNVRTVEPGENNQPIIIEVETRLEGGNNFSEEDARQLASKSIAMGDNVITETFALVLAIQGNKKKAIEVYEKLSLKYPEKKPYFAGKIEELRKN
ncbi:MAG: hypothetical protein IPG60_12645 [Bacteroidetes bacterium]|nr:hypothetical protein [Bacteroidota bacterium]MBK7109793.1 hypothetical protein [Bacteroidota bacterium]MBK8682786.1 hypothetical protein [Bacteroidota bacterium]MBP9704337.1 hypothetical protein [Chitinophagales bacterium]